MTNWEVKYNIKTYIIFEEKMVLNNVTLYSNNKKTYGVVNVSANTIEEAQEKALADINFLFEIIALLFEAKFEFNLMECREIAEEEIPKQVAGYRRGKVTVPLIFSQEMKDKTINYFNKVNRADKVIDSVIKYFIKGIQIEEWISEAYINYFKVIELISNEYNDSAKKEKRKETQNRFNTLIRQLEIQTKVNNTSEIMSLVNKIHSLNFIGLKRRIKVALRDLSLEKHISSVKKIVETRHNIAHGDEQSVIVSKDELKLCRNIARDMIMIYIERKEN